MCRKGPVDDVLKEKVLAYTTEERLSLWVGGQVERRTPDARPNLGVDFGVEILGQNRGGAGTKNSQHHEKRTQDWEVKSTTKSRNPSWVRTPVFEPKI